MSLNTQEYVRNGQWPVLLSAASYLDSHEWRDVRGYIDAPTGSGKTVIFARLLQDLYAKGEQPRTIIIVPTLQLVDQTIEALTTHGYEGEVRKLQGHKKEDGRGDVVVMTQMGFAVQCRSDNLWAIDPELYALIIADEAHHLQGDLTQKVLSKRFEHAGILGFTATPDYDEERQLSNILPDQIHSISTQEAVLEGLIAPYTTALLLTRTDLSEVKVGPNEYVLSDLESALDTDIRNYAISKFFADNLSEHSALFNCSRVTHAEHMAEALRIHGIRAMAVHGKMSRHEQNQILQALHSGEIQAVTQARLLGEGFDEPNIDVVVNVSPTLSFVRAKQRAGRAQRINPENPEKFTLVIECIDTHYLKRPVLYPDQAVSGSWHMFPGEIPDYATTLVQQLGAYELDGLSCVVEVKDSNNWELAELGNLATSSYLPSNLLDTRSYETASPFETVMAPRAKQPRGSYNRSFPLYDGQNGSEQSDHMGDYEFKTPVPSGRSAESHYQPSEFINAPYQAPQNPWLKYVLEGSPPSKDIDIMAAKRALIELAGSKYLKSRSIKERFTRLQFAVSGNNSALFADSREGSFSNHGSGVTNIRLSADAACQDLDQDMFYPERGASTFAAKSLCHICTIRRECLQIALDTSEKTGIWGGLSERQRRRVKRVIVLGGNKGAEVGEGLIEQMWSKDAERIDRQIQQKEMLGIAWR